jgi:hypothetical protein
VGQGQIAVVDLLATRFQGTSGQKRLGGTGAFGVLFIALFGLNPVVGRHPLQGALVRDDFAPAAENISLLPV